MKNIVFGITNLNTGGAEKTLVDITNKLCDKYNITILTLYGGGDLQKNLSEKIKIININKNKLNKIQKKLFSIKLLLFKKIIYKKYIKNKFDVEIAFLEGAVTYLFSTKNENAKKIAWIHTDISKIFGSGLISKLKKFINNKIYKKYNQIIFVSLATLESFNKTYNIDITQKIIHNYINSENIIKKSDENIDFKFDNKYINFLSVCRFVEAKALERLIKIHYNLINEGFIHKIYLIGYGPLENKLYELIVKLNVINTFIILGKKSNPFPYMKACDCFLLTSYYEGFPMVLAEAKILNKHIFATDTAGIETLSDYENKTIAKNNEKSIYEGLQKLINQGINIGSNYKYTNNNILEQIINLLESGEEV